MCTLVHFFQFCLWRVLKTGNGHISATNHWFRMNQTTRCIGDGDWSSRLLICIPASFNTKKKAATGTERGVLPFSERFCTEYTVWISSHSYRAGRRGLKDDFAPCLGQIGDFCPTLPLMPDRVAQRKMKKWVVYTLTLKSGLLTLREIGKHVAASKQPRWLSQYAPFPFLITFRGTLCTWCTWCTFWS